MTDRRPVEWIKSFILNSQKVIQSGDEYAVNLYNEYNQTLMTSFDFSDEELNSVIEYIKAETIKGPPVKEVATVAGADGQQVVQESIISTKVITIFLVILLIILILILVVLFVLVSVLTKYLKQKAELAEEDKELVFQKFDFGHYVRSPAFIWVMTFVFTAIVLKTVIDGLYTVGVQQGYAPTQPIAFSHKVHAGDFQIDCNYCHTGVRESKNANIPSVNICMNCHSSIVKVTGATELSPEIQKIYDARQIISQLNGLGCITYLIWHISTMHNILMWEVLSARHVMDQLKKWKLYSNSQTLLWAGASIAIGPQAIKVIMAIMINWLSCMMKPRRIHWS